MHIDSLEGHFTEILLYSALDLHIEKTEISFVCVSVHIIEKEWNRNICEL